MDVEHWYDQLEVVTENPPNAGTPLRVQTGDAVPPAQVYVRSNFPVPDIDPDTWRLNVGDARLTLDDIAHYERHTVAMAMECAGNGRTLMRPVPGGTPWTLGGASSVVFKGVRLADVLADHLDLSGAQEVVFTGADSGPVPEDGKVPYQFSLTVAEATAGHALLSWSMNGFPLTPEHGAPLRLVVPGQYAMKSVKWLASIRAVDEPFSGHFVRKYRYFGDEVEPEAAPVGSIQIRSLVASPIAGTSVPEGHLTVRGAAWSDGAAITRVEVSADGGRSWDDATLGESDGAFAPTPWTATVRVDKGEAEVVARATDAEGRTQPSEPRWNGNGYGNNVVHRVPVEVI